MFYQRDGIWGVFPKKITWREKKEIYDIESKIYEDNEDYLDVTVEEITLSNEEIERLDLVKDSKNVSIDDIKNYVFEGIETENTSESISINKMKKKIEEMEDTFDIFL